MATAPRVTTVTASQFSEFIGDKEMRLSEVMYMRPSKSYAFVCSYTDDTGQDWLVHVCPPTKKVSAKSPALTVSTMEVDRDHEEEAPSSGLGDLFSRR